MPAGSAPGERRGGRKAGVPNKATLAREAFTKDERAGKGYKLAKEIMADAANYIAAIAINHYTPKIKKNPTEELTEKEIEQNARVMPKFIELMTLAAKISNDLAPYESPKLASVAVRHEPVDLSRLTDDELATAIALARRVAVTDTAPDGTEKTRH